MNSHVLQLIVGFVGCEICTCRMRTVCKFWDSTLKHQNIFRMRTVFELYTRAVKLGHVVCMQYVDEMCKESKDWQQMKATNISICEIAAATGALDCLRHARVNGCD